MARNGTAKPAVKVPKVPNGPPIDPKTVDLKSFAVLPDAPPRAMREFTPNGVSGSMFNPTAPLDLSQIDDARGRTPIRSPKMVKAVRK